MEHIKLSCEYNNLRKVDECFLVWVCWDEKENMLNIYLIQEFKIRNKLIFFLFWLYFALFSFTFSPFYFQFFVAQMNHWYLKKKKKKENKMRLFQFMPTLLSHPQYISKQIYFSLTISENKRICYSFYFVKST